MLVVIIFQVRSLSALAMTVLTAPLGSGGSCPDSPRLPPTIWLQRDSRVDRPGRESHAQHTHSDRTDQDEPTTRVWIHSTPLWKRQSSDQGPSFSRHSLPCSLSFPLRSLLFGDPWRTPSLAEPPLARSSRLSFFRRFIPYGSVSSPQNLANKITQVPASVRQPTSRISNRNCSRFKQQRR